MKEGDHEVGVDGYEVVKISEDDYYVSYYAACVLKELREMIKCGAIRRARGIAENKIRCKCWLPPEEKKERGAGSLRKNATEHRDACD